MPGIEIDRKRIITSDEAIHLKEVPKSIAIMGSGAVGVEFASIFRRFGSDVTIVELLPRLVPVEDEAVSAELEKSFRKQGITVLHRREGHRARRSAPTASTSRRSSPTARRRSSSADYLLVATGRGPVTTGSTPRTLGLQLEKGYIKVDALYRTSVPGHFGDRRRHHARHAGPPAARARVVGRRHHRSPSGSPGQESGRSTTTTCPAAPTAIRKSAASA